MPITKTIPAELFEGVDLHRGDTLRVVESDSDGVLVAIQQGKQAVSPEVDPQKAIDWARNLVGSVKLEPGETVDDVRMAYYREKYGLNEEDEK